MNRIDFGNYNRLSEETADRLIDCLVKSIPEIDVVIINQQVPSGIHTEYFRSRLLNVVGIFLRRPSSSTAGISTISLQAVYAK
ncbi:MAG: hypothetical protein MZV63_36500 [Marinilabiliales bacterium]|nr:hypothetical protein [Marinilabiliales bacterium]